jgi:hypothetical protein
VRQVVKVIGKVLGFVVLAFLLALRIAVAAVLAVITPIVMPVLALLAGGGLLVAMGFASVGHWGDAAKGLSACAICGAAFCLVAALTQFVNPVAFSLPVDFLPSGRGSYLKSRLR